MRKAACCPCGASGRAAAALPGAPMKSRRLIVLAVLSPRFIGFRLNSGRSADPIFTIRLNGDRSAEFGMVADDPEDSLS